MYGDPYSLNVRIPVHLCAPPSAVPAVSAAVDRRREATGCFEPRTHSHSNADHSTPPDAAQALARPAARGRGVVTYPDGHHPPGVIGKDVVVALCGLFSQDVPNYAIEFTGSEQTMSSIPVCGRPQLCQDCDLVSCTNSRSSDIAAAAHVFHEAGEDGPVPKIAPE